MSARLVFSMSKAVSGVDGQAPTGWLIEDATEKYESESDSESEQASEPVPRSKPSAFVSLTSHEVGL